MKNVTNSEDFIDAAGGIIKNLQSQVITTTTVLTTQVNTGNIDTDNITAVTLSTTEIGTGNINADSGTFTTLITPTLNADTINTINLTLTGTLYTPTFTADSVTITDLTADNITAANNITAGNHIQSYEMGVSNNMSVAGVFDSPQGDFGNITVNQIATAAFYKSPGQSQFSYSEGTFTPRISALRYNGTDALYKEDFLGTTNIFGEGYFTKIGSMVTVWYNTRCTIDGSSNAFLNVGKRYPIITDLPFRCSKSIAGSIQTNAALNKNSFPNGYASAIPAPIAPSFTYPFTATVYEAGYEFRPVIPPFSALADPWVADGYTLALSASTMWYVPAVSSFSSDSTVFNFHVLINASYPLAFDGHLRYFTDD